MYFKEIEEAYFHTFPVSETKLEGWSLRTSESEIRRENSVQVFETSVKDIEPLVIECENYYRKLEKPSQFRLFSEVDNGRLVPILQSRGYTLPDSSYVMQRTLEKIDAVAPSHRGDIRICIKTLDDWVRTYSSISGKTQAQSEKMQNALKISEKSSVYGVVERSGEPVCAAMCASCGTICGIFNVLTVAEHRSKGFASLLVRSLLSEAKALGATSAYLQVSQDNLAALKVYRKVGFETAYEYCYWVKSD